MKLNFDPVHPAEFQEEIAVLDKVLVAGRSLLSRIEDAGVVGPRRTAVFMSSAVSHGYLAGIRSSAATGCISACMPILRGMVDSYITMSYVMQAPGEARALTFWNKGHENKEYRANQQLKFYDSQPEVTNPVPPREEFKQDVITARECLGTLEEVRKKRGIDPAILPRTLKMAELCDSGREMGLNGSGSLVSLYNVVYRLISGYVHVGADGLVDHISGIPDNPVFNVLGDVELYPQALSTGALIYCGMLSLFASAFSLDGAEKDARIHAAELEARIMSRVRPSPK